MENNERNKNLSRTPYLKPHNDLIRLYEKVIDKMQYNNE
jgi:hypothetical protein